MPRQDPEAEPIDFAHRVLCPDGACLGLIGDDGRCKVCGRAGAKSGAGPFRSTQVDAEDAETADAAPAAAPEAKAESEAEPDAKAEPAAAAAASSDDDEPSDWDQRLLCPDGACLGVIGANGKCSICGKKGS